MGSGPGTGLLASLLLGAALFAAGPARGAAFDYWVLALSWSPEFCAGQAPNAEPEQCGQPRSFIVHGLWPQYERGFPEYCRTNQLTPEPVIQRLKDIIPSRRLVLHGWRKHGSCSGLSPERYFGKLEQAYRAVKIPGGYLRGNLDRRIPAARLEQAFLDENPGLNRDALTLQCRRGQLSEVRICLDPSLKPRACGSDARDSCGRELLVRSPR